jgi:alkanesulfonate monooxygenase SsuD/methylene tetrahydromethanopterin reductase-like flavin-dependent oxidoreductase (luciferase family)
MAQDFDEYLASIVKAEEAGFDFAWTIDSQILWQDPSIYISRGLAATERLVLGVAVTNPKTRHVTGIACAYGTLDDLHPGRVVIGIGRGDSSVRAMGIKPASGSQLAETVPVIRDLTAGRSVSLNDTDVRLTWRREGASVPIMMGATGPRTLRLAGALADRAMLQVGVDPEAVAWGIEHVRAGARDAGRNPDDVAISVLCACRVSDDQEAAWEACKWSPASAANHIADVAKNVPDHGMPESMVRLIEDRDAFMRDREYDYTKHLDDSADQLDYLTPQHVDDFAITGPPARCLERIGELKRLGVDEISIAYWNGEFDQMDRFGREVIPAASGTPA